MKHTPHQRPAEAISPQRSAPKAFTLIEVLISITLLSLLMGAVTMAFADGQRAFQLTMRTGDIQGQARRTLDRIIEDLAGASRDSLSPLPVAPLGGARLDYQRAEGFARGIIQWSPTTRITFELSPTELDNGADDNGDGLIDEGRIVRISNPGAANEQRIILTHGVARYLEGELPNGFDDNGNGLTDEAGLSFDLEGDSLHVRLTLERVDNEGRQTLRTFESTVLLRN